MSKDIYAEITEKMVAMLDKGIIPWRKTWTCSGGAVSHTTGRPYSFINQCLLLQEGDNPIHALDESFPSREFLTFKQIKEEGGSIKKGQKGSFVVFWKIYQKEIKNDDGSPLLNDSGEQVVKAFPILKYYYVWEVSQCEGIKRKWEQPKRQTETVASAEAVVESYFERESCRLELGEFEKAYYSPSRDLVHAPQITQFDCAEEYYGVLFHEMTHSTGHSSRLNRLTSLAAFGNEDYSKEELVAEFGSAYLANKTGVSSEKAFRNSAAYIQGWSQKLRSDTHLFVNAAAKAEAAVNYILGINRISNK